MRTSQRAGLIAVRAYQLLLAPFAGGACRFEPSCSLYACEAIETHGLTRGLWLGLRRFSRCHPWSPAGADPVPLRQQESGAVERPRGSVLPRI
jgi:putative membrane protein insertion efficiency factor